MLRFSLRRFCAASAATSAASRRPKPFLASTDFNTSTDHSAWLAASAETSRDLWKDAKLVPANWTVLDDRQAATRTFMTDKTTFTCRFIGMCVMMRRELLKLVQASATATTTSKQIAEQQPPKGEAETLFSKLNESQPQHDNANSIGDAGRTVPCSGFDPKMEWHYLRVKLTVPLNHFGFIYAQFLNTMHSDDPTVRKLFVQEAPSEAPNTKIMSLEQVKDLFPEGLVDHVMEHVGDDFVLMQGGMGKKGTSEFLHQHLLEWHQRADYLVKRRSREPRELTDLTMADLQVQHRTRRKVRAEQREKKQKKKLDYVQQVVKNMDVEDAENDAEMIASCIVEDVVPREARDRIEKDRETLDYNQRMYTGGAHGGGVLAPPNSNSQYY